MRIILTLVVALSLTACDTTETDTPPDSPAAVATDISVEASSADNVARSSGYADLEGAVINYEYHGFGGFYVKIFGETMRWRGFKGIGLDIVNEVNPVTSKVADGVYFISWPTGPDEGDNVVYNLNTMEVFAHLGGGAQFAPISGPIHCWQSPECNEPSGALTDGPTTMAQMAANAENAGVSMEEVMAGQAGPADAAGEAALSGKTLVLKTSEGRLSVSINGDQTTAQLADRPATTHTTYATRIANGIYFVSWDNGRAGNHLVVNTLSLKAYDHILADHSRAEAIYDLVCFDNTEICTSAN